MPTYLRVGRLLHLIALYDVIVVSISVYWLVTGFSGLPQWVPWLLIITFGCQFALAELDAYSRLQNFKQLRDQLYFNGYQNRILRPMTKSRCQRDAALLACRQMGYEHEARKLYKSLGYKWYHIPPDFVFTHPLFFFSRYFWRTTFFVPHYKPKMDYNKVLAAEFTKRTQMQGIGSAV